MSKARRPLVRWTPPQGELPGDPTCLPYVWPRDGWGTVPDCPGGGRRLAQIPQEEDREGDRDADPFEE